MQLVLISVVFLVVGVSSRPKNDVDVNEIKITEESNSHELDDQNYFITPSGVSTERLPNFSSKTPSTVLLPPDLPSSSSKSSLELSGNDASVTLGSKLEVSDEKQEDYGGRNNYGRKYSEVGNFDAKITPGVNEIDKEQKNEVKSSVNKLDDSDSAREEADDVDYDIDGNSKKFGLFPFINPGHIFDPINDKLSKLAAALTHPNGFAFPLWSKLQSTSSHLFGPNASIFGLGQIGGHDYPFPYRKARDVSDDIRNKAGEEILAYLKKLEEAAKNELSLLPFIEQYKKILQNLQAATQA